MRPTRPGSAPSVNHRLPSAPATMSVGALFGVSPVVYAVTRPVGVMRPIAPAPPRSVNQTLPSGPFAMPVGWPSGVMPVAYSVTLPVAGSRRAIWPVTPSSVNHRSPPGPEVMWLGTCPEVKPGTTPATYSVIEPSGAIRPIPPGPPCWVNQRLPSEPVVMSEGWLPSVRFVVNSVMEAPAVAGAASAPATARIGSSLRPCMSTTVGPERGALDATWPLVRCPLLACFPRAAPPPARFEPSSALQRGPGQSNLPVPHTEGAAPISSPTFADLGVSRAATGALARRGISEPFAVQRLVIPDALAGRDVLAESPTGSGKTLAFVLPVLERLTPEDPRPAALVLAPTRELAGQIVDDAREVAKAHGLTVAAVYGGVGIERQAKAARRAHLLVATPGRLLDLMNRGDLSLAKIRILVLDEADRMMDMGFRPDLERIVSKTPGDRQTLLFSATLAGAPGDLARSYTRNARRHEHRPEARKSARVEHRFVRVLHEASSRRSST